MRDLQLRLAEDNARLLFARRLRLAGHGILQCAGNYHVTHLDGGHRYAPWGRPLSNKMMPLSLDPRASTEQVGQCGPANDASERCLGRRTDRLRIVLNC